MGFKCECSLCIEKNYTWYKNRVFTHQSSDALLWCQNYTLDDNPLLLKSFVILIKYNAAILLLRNHFVFFNDFVVWNFLMNARRFWKVFVFGQWTLIYFVCIKHKRANADCSFLISFRSYIVDDQNFIYTDRARVTINVKQWNLCYARNFSFWGGPGLWWHVGTVSCDE